MSTVNVTARSMTVLEQDRPVVVETIGREPPRRRSWLVGALVVAVLVIAGLGGRLSLEHHASSEDQAATTTVTAWLDAFNAHDPAVLWGLSSRAWTWESAGGPNGQSGPYTGTDLLGVISSDWKVDPGSGIRRQGELVVMGDTQVAAPVQVSHLSGVTGASPLGTGVLLFNLTTEDGELKVAEVMWLSSR